MKIIKKVGFILVIVLLIVIYITNKDTKELKRQWDIKRELLVDEILQEAEKNGIKLEYTPPQDDTTLDDTSSKGGFIQGIKDGVQTGIDASKENIDEFNKIMNGKDEKEK